MITPDTEIRKLPLAHLLKLGHILQVSDSWRKLMTVVTTEDNDNEPLFTGDHMKMIEQGSRLQKRAESEVFLEEWSTLGKKRPTCQSLLNHLIKSQLFRAADYLAVNVMGVDRPERPSGPAEDIKLDDINLEDELDASLLNYHESMSVFNQQAQSKHLIEFTRSDLMKFPPSDSNYSLHVADSDDIPCVVQGYGQPAKSDVNDSTTDFENTSDVQSSTRNCTESEDESTTDTSRPNLDSSSNYDYSVSSMPIPLVVLQMTAKTNQEDR